MDYDRPELGNQGSERDKGLTLPVVHNIDRNRIILFVLASLVYIGAFPFAFPYVGPEVAAGCAIPVLILAGAGNARLSFSIAFVFLFAINPLLFYFFAPDINPGRVITTIIPGVSILLFTTYLVSRDGRLILFNRAVMAKSFETEQKLRASEKQYRVLFDSMNEPVLIFNPENETILSANTSAAELYGYPVDQLIGKSIKDFSLDPHRGETQINRLFLDGYIQNFETVQLNRKNEPLYLLINASLINYEGSRAVLSINRNITDRKLAESQLLRRLEFEEVLATITRALISENVDLSIVLERLCLVLKTNQTGFYRFSSDRSSVQLIARWPDVGVKNEEKDWIERSEILPAVYLSILQAGETIAVSDFANEVASTPLDVSLPHSLMLVPVSSGTMVIGFLTLEDYQQKHDWAVEETQVVRMIGDMLATYDARMVAEKEARFQQGRLNRILNSIPIGISERDAEGRFTFVNDNLVALFGQDRSALIGRTIEELFGKNYLSELIDSDDKVRRMGEGVFIRELEYYKDNELQCVLTGRTLLEPKKPKESAVIGFIIDITSRKKAERDLLAQKELIRSVIDTDPNIIYVKDSSGRFILVNRAFDELISTIFDQSSSSSIEMANQSLVENGIFSDSDMEVIRSSVMSIEEVPFRLPDGQVRWYLNTKAPLQLPDGTLNVLNISVNTTDRKIMEEELRESRDKFSKLVEELKDVIFQTDTNGRFTFLNKTWFDISGYTVEESLGKSFFRFIHPEERRSGYNSFQIIIDGSEQTEKNEVRLMNRSGGFHWLDMHLKPVVSPQGIITGVSGLLHDVTEQRQAIVILQENLKKERELRDMKSRFVSMASHELRTPLAAIKSAGELLSRFGYKYDEDRKNVLFERIDRNVKTMTDLVDDVLLLGKAESDRLPFVPEILDMGLFVEQFVAEFSQSIRQSHMLNTRISAQKTLVEFDPKLVHIILTNLLSNAVKYSEEGSSVEVEVDAQWDGVSVKVRDSGIGIPQAEIPSLFEPFYRASNVETRQGTGLGLSIVKRIVDMHGGQIKVISRASVGTEFVVLFPNRLEKTWEAEVVEFPDPL